MPLIVKGEHLVLRRDGVWISNGVEITHEPTVSAFSRSVRWDAVEKKYCVALGYEVIYVEVEDTAYFVTSLFDQLAKISNGSIVDLQASQLKYERESLYLILEGGERARFLSEPFYDLMRGLKEDVSAYYLVLDGTRVDLLKK